MQTIIMLILLVARLIIAVQLTRVSIRQKLPNLMWLAVFFYVTCLGDFFFDVVPVFWLFGLGIGLGEIAMVLFIHQTFYKGRKSPYLYFMGVAIFFTFVDVYFPATSKNIFPYFSPFKWIWLIVVGSQAYKQIASDKTVESWIKARYRLVIVYAALSLGAPIQSLIAFIASFFPLTTSIYNNPIFSVYNWCVFTATVIGVVLSYLAWIMPKSFMRFLNRNDQAPSTANMKGEQMSEEEVLKQLQSM